MTESQEVFKFIEHLETLTGSDDVWTAFLRFAGKFGFTHGGLADMPGPGEKLQDTILCLSWPKEWSERYFRRNYIFDDPARLHLSQSSEPYTWRDMTSCPAYSKNQKTIVFEASEFRMKVGIIFPMLGINRGPAMVTIAGENDGLSRIERISLHLAATYTHALVRKLSGAKRKTNKIPTFSARERECLQWYAAGKSESEIGEILSISDKTANTYLERARLKFGLYSRRQVVAAALQAGIIHY